MAHGMKLPSYYAAANAQQQQLRSIGGGTGGLFSASAGGPRARPPGLAAGSGGLGRPHAAHPQYDDEALGFEERGDDDDDDIDDDDDDLGESPTQRQRLDGIRGVVAEADTAAMGAIDAAGALLLQQLLLLAATGSSASASAFAAADRL